MRHVLLFILIISSFCVNAQSEKEIAKAEKLALEAIDLMNERNFDKALTLLLKAHKIHPDRMDYPYEIAYALYSSKLYSEAIDWLTPLTSHPDVTDLVFQLLGNAYDLEGDSDKAVETYKLGLKSFPNSGKLYLEAGGIENSRGNYNEAIQYWEQGIKVEPNYSSNYYWLAKTFARTDERIWALIYGEMFIDLELGSSRTEEISKLLYDNYKKSYINLSDSTGEFQLTKIGFEIVIDNKKDLKQIKKKGLPFEGTFATVFSFSALSFHDGIDLESIYKARLNFVNNWFQKHDKNYPNSLFDFQKKLIEAGVFEAYCYYIISKGDMDSFSDWQNKNQDSFNLFADWIQSNPIKLKSKDFYARTDY